ncbi:MAG: hypothetical protein ACRD3N_10200 [Terracidiphilus sp.]
MKIVSLIARYLLALIFLVFGMNHYLSFIHAAMPGGTAGQFMGALMVSHYLYVVAFFEVAPAVLLLIGRFVPLALTVLAGVIINIFLTGLLMTALALPISIVLIVLWFLAFFRVRSAFAGIFQARVAG